jgi:hypothetical protein
VEYLQIDDIRGRASEIREALESLMSSKVMVVRRGALQWAFLRDCLERLLTGDYLSPFDGLAPVQVGQYKFEIEDRLRRFYLHPGKPVDYVFRVVHATKLSMHGLDETYPSLAGYCLLVRNLAIDRVVGGTVDAENIKLYFERVVAEANDAEFRAYDSLPVIRTDELDRWFCAGSPAYNEIRNILERHYKRKWVISNPYNPSTKRIQHIKVKQIGPEEAMVDTMEYWYLRWWDELEGSYVYSYRESNRQMYVLRKDGDDWKVYKNLRGQPRTSTPYRWNRRQRLNT